MSVLILDPLYASFEDKVSEWVGLARQRMSRPIRRLPFFEGQIDGRRWIGEVFEALDEANIIVCLGDFTIMRQVGTDVHRMLQIIGDKASKGCPILFQAIGARYRIDQNIAPDGFESLLRGFGCNPMDVKVGSNLYATAEHQSPYVCEFNVADDCFNDPQLFEGIDRIVGSAAYLLDYEPASFPILEVSPLHFLVDGKSDFFTSGVPGRRNALATRKRTGLGTQIILSVDVLRNGYESLGGHVAGVNQNQLFAARLIDFLDNESRVPNRNRDDAYDLFAALERMLGQFVYDVLSPKSNDNTIDKFLPERVKNNIRNKLTQKLEYSRAYYADIVSILRENWSEFELYFNSNGTANDRSSVSKLLFSVNDAQRVNLAHPHRAHQLGIKFGENDISILKTAVSLVRNANFSFEKLRRNNAGT
jgi:hypothetical protein